MQVVVTIAESIIAICAMIALYQIVIAKKDISIRSKRESVTSAIKQVEYFRLEILSGLNKLDIALNKLGSIKNERLFESREDVKDFTLEELKSKNLLNKFVTKMQYVTQNNLAFEVSEVANKLEYFSLAFVSGAASEEVAFNPTADTFCEFIDQHYEFYCFHRKEGNYRYYNSTIELYRKWKTRIEKNRIEFKKETYDAEIRTELNKIRDENLKAIKPIGL